MKRTCNTCRHWGGPDRQYIRSRKNTVHRLCRALPAEISTPDIAGLQAYLLETDNCEAQMMTAPNFGCLLWEAAPDAPQQTYHHAGELDGEWRDTPVRPRVRSVIDLVIEHLAAIAIRRAYKHKETPGPTDAEIEDIQRELEQAFWVNWHEWMESP